MTTRRTLVLELDELDYGVIQQEIAEYQRACRIIAPENGTLGILPEGDSNLAGAIIAECIRNLREYRDLYANDERTPE